MQPDDEDDAPVEALTAEQLEEQLEEAGLVRAPDGGWGWVIVFGSFVANVLVDGVIFTAGQAFQPEWEQAFDSSSGETAWCVSLLAGIYLLAGPVVSALANYFGCRNVVIAGTFVAFTGFMLSVFARGLPILYLCFGVLGGIGFGMIYLPAVVIVSYYFKERRAFATGIAVCGSGIGTFVFAPLIKYLLDIFTWRQSLTIIAGLTLNCIVCGMLFRPLQPSQKNVEKVAELALSYQKSLSGDRLANGAAEGDDAVAGLRERLSKQDGGALEPRPRQHAHSLERPFVSVVELRVRRRHATMMGQAGADKQDCMISRECLAELNRPLSRRDIFYTGSVTNVGRPSRTSATMQSVLSVQVPADVLDTAEPSWSSSVTAALRSMLDVELLRSPSFMLLATGGFLTLCGFFVPFVYLPRQAMAVGHNKGRATFLVSVLGMTNIVARIICGWLSDQPRFDALVIHNVAVTLGGLATVAVPFLQSYWLLCAYCVVFGFGTACFASLRSIICVDLLGLDKLTSAFGFLLLFMGVAGIVGSPLAGFLYDLTGNYNLSFYVTGALMTLSGLLGFPLRTIARWERDRDTASEHSSEHEMRPLDPLPS